MEKADMERQEVSQIPTSYGLTAEEAAPVVEALSRRPKRWVEFMMKFELALEQPDPKRALSSGLTIGGAYALGGLVPLVPYKLIPVAAAGLNWSVACTLLALFFLRYMKGGFTGTNRFRSAVHPRSSEGSPPVWQSQLRGLWRKIETSAKELE